MRKLSAEQIQTIITRYRAGEKGPRLALEYNVSKASLYSVLQMHGVVKRTRKGYNYLRLRLRKSDMLAIVRIAEQNNVSVGEYAAAIIVDAIVEETMNGIQRSGTEGRSTSGESRSVEGATAP